MVECKTSRLEDRQVEVVRERGDVRLFRPWLPVPSLSVGRDSLLWNHIRWRKTLHSSAPTTNN